MNEEDGMCACAINGKITSVPKHILKILEDQGSAQSKPSSGL